MTFHSLNRAEDGRGNFGSTELTREKPKPNHLKVRLGQVKLILPEEILTMSKVIVVLLNFQVRSLKSWPRPA